MTNKTLKQAIASGCRTQAELKQFYDLEWLNKNWKTLTIKLHTNKDRK